MTANRVGRGRAGRLLGRCVAVLLGAVCLLAPPAALAGTAYVVNDGESTVTPINTATNVPGTPITVKGNPVGVAITPDGKTAYVGSYGSLYVTPIDTATNAVEPGIPIGGSLPEVIAITPDGSTAYVASVGVNRVTPIDIATNTPEESITVGENPSGIAITPDGKTAYVTDGDGVTPIDTATNKAGSPINVGEGPEGIAITPDGKTAYVTNELGTSVTPIDIATNTPGTPIAVGSHPNAIAITPDGKTAYVTNDGGTSVTPIDIATNTPGTPITVGSYPSAVAITPDGRTAYVTDNGTSVTPIDIATNTPGTPIKVGEDPDGIAITPDQAPLAAFSATSATLGQPTSFDASASVDPDGSVAAYSWSFGDGATLVTTAPTTSHTYTAAATYTATLTLTDNEGCSTAFVFTGQTALCDGSPGASSTRQVTVAAAPVQLNQSPAPNSSFSVLSTKLNKKTGAITFTGMVSDPGTFTATLSFRNGKFGVFSATKRIACKKGQVRLRGKCRPATVRFGSIRKTVAAAGIVVFTVTPSASATKALKLALEKQHGLGVTALLSYQSARGGSPASRTVSVEDKLAKPKTKRAK